MVADQKPEKIDTPSPLAQVFADLGIQVETWQHMPVFTVEEGRHIKEIIPGGHTKNLFLKDKKGEIWLIVAAESTRIDLKTLHRRLGCGRLSFGRPELLKEILGVAPGSVTPFALINDKDRRVKVGLDAAMLDYTLLNYHPLKNDKTTTIAAKDLLTFLESLGYQPVIIDFTQK